MKIKFNSDNNLPLNDMLMLHMLTVIVISIFKADGKYYPQVFLDVCLSEVKILEYDRTDISVGIDIKKTNPSKEC